MKRSLLFFVLLLPLLYLLISVQSANDPIKYIFTCTGISSLIILILSLSLTPLKKIINLIKYRRMMGLFSFFYALLHFLNFYILDAQFDVTFVLKETLDKPFIYLGMIAFSILLFMAITSTRKLFAKFNKWHKLVYIVLILVVIHEAMAQKVLGNLEFMFIFMTIVLLGYRAFLFRVKWLKKKK
ncbi:ferric reductase-like transmembrane domain-containing protein [Sulfurospirillum arcachonense]|uniref:ferric reductase-like transmembrane domain-containing protein n=1 Tax=Sulfurospirillum arcachonense TaxID=57666 RepID=UPI00046AB21B|nr:ferric reductase-like transmembrane domain-containing protein [Sulfurospirillum arcachonense]